MKKIIGLLFLFGCFACSTKNHIEISVENPSEISRPYEIIEIPLDDLTLVNGTSFIIKNKNGTEIEYQITHDKKLIFPVSISANDHSTYFIQPGTPQTPKTITQGKQYPERLDDIAWENDRIAFRTYGPALQATGEKAFGYDVWVKRTTDLVVQNRYAKELNPETVTRISALRQTDSKAASELYNTVSYHIDHGDGLDYYSVGPTLGAGTAALLINDTIIYPYCYNTYEILDNGPLRFTVKLRYNPLIVGNNSSVIETRIISLDAGSQLNKTTLTYENLNKVTSLVTGLVVHEGSSIYQANTEKGYIAYADPADQTNGQTYIGAVFPQPEIINETKVVYFSDEEKNARRANGHILAFSDYHPQTSFTYYWGAGWSKWGFYTPDDWFEYIAAFAEKIQNPLIITIKGS